MIYTNGAYEIEGTMEKGILKGIIVSTRYSSVYEISSAATFPEYHNYFDKEPQFMTKPKYLQKIRREKLDKING